MLCTFLTCFDKPELKAYALPQILHIFEVVLLLLLLPWTVEFNVE